MCGRYTQTKTKRELQAHFQAETQDVLPRFNVAPTQNALVLATESPRIFSEMRWGIERSWNPADKNPELLINAKAETIAEKRTFKNLFQSQRCLVAADGFYEWRRDGSAKQPVRFTLHDEGIFAFGGIWQNAGQEKRFVIITTEPNELVRPVHNRMPLILDPESYGEWLSPDTPFERLAPLLNPMPAHRMKACDVNPVVGNAKIDTAECIQPYRPPQGLLF